MVVYLKFEGPPSDLLTSSYANDMLLLVLVLMQRANDEENEERKEGEEGEEYV
jgi:hypothetical protein